MKKTPMASNSTMTHDELIGVVFITTILLSAITINFLVTWQTVIEW